MRIWLEAEQIIFFLTIGYADGSVCDGGLVESKYCWQQQQFSYLEPISNIKKQAGRDTGK